MSSVLNELENILEIRKSADPENSYVAFLYDQGLDHILKKIGEESAETVIAAKNITNPKKNNADQNQDEHIHLIHEATDLVFHLLVLLHQQNIAFSDIELEMTRRFGCSGHVEKALRK